MDNNSLMNKKCDTCKSPLRDTAKKSQLGNFIYCDLCKAVYTVEEVEQFLHPEFGPSMILKIQLMRKGNLKNLPKPKLEDNDVSSMKRLISESFGPIQFADLIKEYGNTAPDHKNIGKKKDK